MPSADDVYDLVSTLLDEGRMPSADTIVARLGGSKTSILALRDEAYERLRAKGRATDPMAELQTAAEPMLRKLIEVATRRTERAYLCEIDLLKAQIQTLNADVEKAFGAEERAAKAEEQHAKLAASYQELNQVIAKQTEAMLADRARASSAEERAQASDEKLASLAESHEELVEAFTSLAAGLKPSTAVVPPSDGELETMLRAGRFDERSPNRSELCERMLASDPSLTKPLAQLAISRAMAAGYLAVETLTLTKKGKARFDNPSSAPQAAPARKKATRATGPKGGWVKARP